MSSAYCVVDACHHHSLGLTANPKSKSSAPLNALVPANSICSVIIKFCKITCAYCMPKNNNGMYAQGFLMKHGSNSLQHHLQVSNKVLSLIDPQRRENLWLQQRPKKKNVKVCNNTQISLIPLHIPSALFLLLGTIFTRSISSF
jgi:hypothetical protein